MRGGLLKEKKQKILKKLIKNAVSFKNFYSPGLGHTCKIFSIVQCVQIPRITNNSCAMKWDASSRRGKIYNCNCATSANLSTHLDPTILAILEVQLCPITQIPSSITFLTAANDLVTWSWNLPCFNMGRWVDWDERICQISYMGMESQVPIGLLGKPKGMWSELVPKSIRVSRVLCQNQCKSKLSKKNEKITLTLMHLDYLLIF